MKFITNRISKGKQKSFSDLVSEYRKKDETVKTASAKEEVKVAEAEKDEADSSGQPEWEGKKENVNDPQPCDEKEASSNVQDTDNENNSEADSSGQPEWEGKKENVNNPEPEKHRDGDGDQKEAEAEAKVKEAKTEAEVKEDEAKKEEETDKKEAKADDGVKEAAGLDNFGDKKAEPFGKKDDSDDDKEEKEDKDDDKKDDKEECDDKKEEKEDDEKEASASIQLVKIANLDGKSKTWLSKYWSQLYPQSYVDAMIADK